MTMMLHVTVCYLLRGQVFTMGVALAGCAPISKLQSMKNNPNEPMNEIGNSETDRMSYGNRVEAASNSVRWTVGSLSEATGKRFESHWPADGPKGRCLGNEAGEGTRRRNTPTYPISLHVSLARLSMESAYQREAEI